MPNSLNVSMSAQVALMSRLDTLAQNVANISTAGYRASKTSFSEVISNKTDLQTAFVKQNDPYVSTRAGELVPTGNKLDVAVSGDGWFAIQTPAGTAYTRDGRMRMDVNGELRSVAGFQFLDVGGSPLVVDPVAGAPEIARDGMIVQDGRALGAIGLFKFDPNQVQTQRTSNAALLVSGQVEPVLDFVQDGVVQGFIEQSNVNAIEEITELISAHRGFDRLGQSVRNIEESLQSAIRTLGEVS